MWTANKQILEINMFKFDLECYDIWAFAGNNDN